MEEQLISYQTALLAKEKGFNIPTKEIFMDNGMVVNNGYFPEKHSDDVGVVAQSQLQKWLREEQHIILTVDYNYINKDNYEFLKETNYQCTVVYNKDNKVLSEIIGYGSKTYEEALEVGLQYSLTLIKI